MGRVSFHSQETRLNAPPSKVFTFLSNLDNLEKLMPEQVINWKSDGASCSFDIKGMAHIDLLIGKKEEDRLIVIDSGPKNPINIQLEFAIEKEGEENSSCVISLHAELSMMLQMMASTPLQNLVNIMADKLAPVF